MKETRKGTYADINGSFPSDKVYEKTYFKMGVNHSQQVKDGTYQYVMLPGYTKEELEEFAQNITVEVLNNRKDIQAIKNGNSFGANIWNQNGDTVNASASIYSTVDNGVLNINISDPKQKTKLLNLKMDYNYIDILSTSDTVSVKDDGSFDINTEGSAGATHTIKLLISNRAELNKVLNDISKLNKEDYTTESWNALCNILKKVDTLDEFVTQKDVDLLVKELNIAIQALVKRPSETDDSIDWMPIKPSTTIDKEDNKVDEKIDSVKTGYQTNTSLYFITAFISMICGVFVFKKKKISK